MVLGVTPQLELRLLADCQLALQPKATDQRKWAFVLDDLTLGAKSIIVAGAGVTKDIPPHSVAVGVPARVINKSRYS